MEMHFLLRQNKRFVLNRGWLSQNGKEEKQGKIVEFVEKES